MNGPVTIVNNTKEKITVSITNIGENGGAGFYEIASKGSDTWHRTKLQSLEENIESAESLMGRSISGCLCVHHPIHRCSVNGRVRARMLVTLSSETGKRGHAHNLLTLARLSKDTKERDLLVAEARNFFKDLEDGYGLTLCDLYSDTSVQSMVKLALKFEVFRDFEMAATCHKTAFESGILPPTQGRISVEYIKFCAIAALSKTGNTIFVQKLFAFSLM
ncbi:hypothetical protein BDR07DRAFT_1467267 [Suillus spraguei]|nr:hypothetical protein BDR07DRAFT_1467267 [Suillus spraguei]